jgi:hypothetical protein
MLAFFERLQVHAGMRLVDVFDGVQKNVISTCRRRTFVLVPPSPSVAVIY